MIGAMLLIGGQPANVPDASKVRDHITFTPGMANTTRQRDPWHGMGIHWTGGEGSLDTFIRVLTKSRLSCPFWIDDDGAIVQLADVMTLCAHIGAGNKRFIGLEVKCRGYATKEEWAAAKLSDPSLLERDKIDWKTKRDTYTDVIGGQRVKLAGYTPEQLRSTIWLAETLSGLMRFPRLVPATTINPADLKTLDLPVSNPDDFLVWYEGKMWLPWMGRDTRPNGLIATHRGALGHFHVHAKKHDPGSQILLALWAEGWNPAQRRLPAATTL